MAAFLIAVLVVAAVINYVLVSSHFKDYVKNEESKTWYRIIRLILTIGVTLMILTYCFMAYYLWILPTFHNLFTFEGLLHGVFFFYIWLNIVFNYFAVILTSPGRAYTLAQLQEEGYSNENVHICKKCNRLKSTGTVHCTACGYCVRLASHHSYLLNNCLGLNNYSYYYLLLCYSCLGQVYGIYELFRPVQSCVLHKTISTVHCEDPGDVLVKFLLLIAGLISTGSTLFFHSILLRVDKSQKEIITEIRSSSSYCKFLFKFLVNVFRRRLNRHRLQHLISERKPSWLDILLPSLNEPPIDLSAEDVVDYDTEAQHMI